MLRYSPGFAPTLYLRCCKFRYGTSMTAFADYGLSSAARNSPMISIQPRNDNCAAWLSKNSACPPTNLKSILTFDPKTGLVTSVVSRPVKVLRAFPTGTDFGSSTTLLGSGSRTFTHRSTDANGYFEVTYKVEEVKTLLLTR